VGYSSAATVAGANSYSVDVAGGASFMATWITGFKPTGGTVEGSGTGIMAFSGAASAAVGGSGAMAFSGGAGVALKSGGAMTLAGRATPSAEASGSGALQFGGFATPSGVQAPSAGPRDADDIYRCLGCPFPEGACPRCGIIRT
jgi:hypothetical protein